MAGLRMLVAGLTILMAGLTMLMVGSDGDDWRAGRGRPVSSQLPSSSSIVTGKQVRAVLFGEPVDGVHVVRQARRLTHGDSEELVLVDARGIWWVARRGPAQVHVWVYVGDAEAEVAFEGLVEAASAGDDAWIEAERAVLVDPG